MSDLRRLAEETLLRVDTYGWADTFANRLQFFVAIDETLAELDRLRERSDGWRDVATDPPPLDVWVLVHSGDRADIVIQARRDGNGWYYYDGTGAPLSDEKYWMPMPPLPRKGKL